MYFYVSHPDFLKFKMHLFKMNQSEAIIQLHCAEKTNPVIVKILKAPKSIVWFAIKKLGHQMIVPDVNDPQLLAV